MFEYPAPYTLTIGHPHLARAFELAPIKGPAA